MTEKEEITEKRYSFTVAICSHRGTQAEAAQSIELLHQLAGNMFITRYYAGDAWIDRLRSVAATEFYKHNIWGDYMIFIDDDIVFLPEHVLVLYEDMAKLGYDLIGGLYATRSGTQLASYGLSDRGGITIDGKIHEIRWLATGFMGFSRRLLNDMVTKLELPLLHQGQWCENYPFFVFHTHKTEGGNYMLLSEDWDFPLAMDTPVLTDKFTWKPLGEVNIGDKLIGFDEPKVNGRHYVINEVTDVMHQSLSPYRIITTDGEIIASAKHPFLRSAPCGSGTRWDTTERLIKGQFLNIPIERFDNPVSSMDYKRGYIKGIWAGDGTIESHGYATLEMTDKEAIDRAWQYIQDIGLKAGDIKQRQLNNPNWKPLWGFRCSRGIKDMLKYPLSSESFAKGFLAGIYDAEGSYSLGRLRIAVKDESIADEIKQALRITGIDMECHKRPDDLYEFTTSNHKIYHKFWQLMNPAISRKKSINGHNGTGIMQYKKAEIIAVEPTLQRQDLMCITTTSHNFIANGFASHNCEKAKSIGYKVYADTRCVVGHKGDKVYALSDVINHNRILEMREKRLKGILDVDKADIALRKTVDVLESMGCSPWIDSGTLLSTVRDKDFNKFDHDIDIRIFKEDIPDERMPDLIWNLYNAGYKTIQQNTGDRKQLLGLWENEVMLDLKFVEHNDEWVWYYVWDKVPGSSIFEKNDVVTHVFPKKFYEDFEEIELKGRKYRAPSPVEEYLTYHYGNSWREFKAKPENVDETDFTWDASKSPPCVKSLEQLAELTAVKTTNKGG